jgi:polyphosphate:AMP phosphotransferase
MFADAELNHRLDRRTFERREPALRRALLDAQYRLLEQKRSALVLLPLGEPGAGRTEFVNALLEWLDPRHVEIHAYARLSEEDRERPPLWRFWRDLPPKGKLSIYLQNWYSAPLHRRLMRDLGRVPFLAALERIKQLEAMLHAEGHDVLKLWFHLPAKEMARRLEALAGDAKTAWRVTREDRDIARALRRRPEIVERALRETSSAECPWTVIDGHDRHWAKFDAGKRVLAALESLLAAPAPGPVPKPAPATRPPTRPNVLASLDQTLAIGASEYEREITKWQARLAHALRRKGFRERAAIVVFEGYDAAGKGGAIRRVAQAIDARFVRIVPIAAPSDEERARPYLWRFWRHLPRHGQLTIFDRSWYGRVLVERVEGYCREADWRRAYGEINEFEEQLADDGVIIAKFFLAVSPEEQLRRFRERARTPWKRFKIGPDDWRNREKRIAYDHAIVEMVARTSTDSAPWVMVEGDDKQHARVRVLRSLVKRIEATL